MPTTAPDAGIRLQKFLADAGVCSRREAERRIGDGRVSVNGKTVTEMGIKVTATDRVEIDGKPVTSSDSGKKVYILLNKPEGIVTSCKHKGEKVVTDLVKVPERIFPVGRLDKDSCGLLLLTNDGPLHHRLSHPSFDHEKEYVVDTKEPLTDADMKALADGVVIDGRRTRKAVVKRMGESRFRIILKEGRNRQIRKMVETRRNKVTTLKRVRMANLKLSDLGRGKWRHLTENELKILTKMGKSPGRHGRNRGA